MEVNLKMNENDEKMKNDLPEENAEEKEQETHRDESEEPKESGKETHKSKKEEKKLKKENAELTEELNKLKYDHKDLGDKYLRLIAEYDNFRKRSQKERETIYADAYTDVLVNILPVIDNLERALMFGESGQVVDGVKMTLAQFNTALEKLGIKQIETKTFDPKLHNAVMHVDDEAYGENEIVEVFQKGYIKGDKVIRFAMVKVAN